jgi:hypothetical protein
MPPPLRPGPATAPLAAARVLPGREDVPGAPAAPASSDPAPFCRNCNAPLPAPPPPFCAQCGQETRLRPPTLLEFVQQFGGAIVSTEGALWRTLVLLLAWPGELTRRFLAGQRRRYVLPLRLYLTISVSVLLAVRLTAHVGEPGIGAERSSTRSGEVNLVFGRAGLKDGKFFCEGFPDRMCQRLKHRLDADPKVLARELQQLGERFIANLGGAMFLLLPVFALVLKLLYLNRRLYYTEHLVFALHLHAFWFLAIGLALLPLPWVDGIALAAAPLYALLAMRRVYAGRWWPLLLRAAVLSLAYLVTLGVALAGVALYALLV